MITTLLIGFILGFATVPVYNDMATITDNKEHIVYIPTTGIANPIVGNCRDIRDRNGHGWEFNVREYYDCNELQIIISDMVYKDDSK